MGKKTNNSKVCIVGGAGHIGLPLSCFLQNKGLNVKIVDNNSKALKMLSAGMPTFYEAMLEENLKNALSNGLTFTNDIQKIKDSKFVIVTIGTASNKKSVTLFNNLIEDVLNHIDKNSYLLLRSTVTKKDIESIKNNSNFNEKKINLSYCPERIAEGIAFEELNKLPQIIGTENDEVDNTIKEFFYNLDIETIFTSFDNAIFIKLFSNAYRHANFSLTNEFFNIATANNLDFENILKISTYKYPRLANLPKTGYVGGPCLPKDLDTFIKSYDVNNSLLNKVENVNETFIDNIVSNCLRLFKDGKIIQLGLTFKENSDDLRGSGSIVLNKKLKDNDFEVYAVDPLVNKEEVDFELFDFSEAINHSKNIIVSVNHKVFHDLDFSNKKILYAEI